MDVHLARVRAANGAAGALIGPARHPHHDRSRFRSPGAMVWLLMLISMATSAAAQSSAFTYQGRLTAAGTAAQGSYDMRFALFDSVAAGTQIGADQTMAAVLVSDGFFTVQLDFGVDAFPGPNRFLEISVRPAGGGTFTTLVPRQQLTSTPYAIQTLNAQQLGGVPASQYVKADADGNVGIGTTAPNAVRLFIAGGPGWTANGWQGSLGLQNGAALGWTANDSTQQFGIGQTIGGLYFFRTTSAFGTTPSPAMYDMKLSDLGNLELSGNALQARDQGGWIKALAGVNPDGTIVRCYNSHDGTSTLGCGFGMTHTPGSGLYKIDFGFEVDDRFVSVTPLNVNPLLNAGALTWSALKLDLTPTVVDIMFSGGAPNLNDSGFDVVVY